MKKDIDLDAVKFFYYEKELSVTETAKKLGVPWHSVYSFMDRHGLKRRSRSEGQKLRYAKERRGPPIEEILRLYFDEELSSFAVAARVGLSQSTVRDRIRKAGYVLRNIKESRSAQKTGRVLIVFNDEQQSQIEHLYCVEKASLAMIGFRFDVSPQIIKRTLVEMGVQLRTLQESQQIRRDREIERHERRITKKVGEVLDASAVSAETVIELYKSKELLLDEIAVKCSLDRLEVYEILRDAGLVPDYGNTGRIFSDEN